MNRYGLMYKLGFAPWERRDVADFWRSLLDVQDAPAPGRALDVGCGRGRDAVHLASRGWRVTGVEYVEKALDGAKQRAADQGVEVEWVCGDVAALGRLGLEPGYDLLYDFGCLHGLDDAARRGAAPGITSLAAPGATLLMVAFKARRRLLLPRGMDEQEIVALMDSWELVGSQSVVTDDMPPPVRKADPTLYRLSRR